ncbi:MAG: hypothetical protein HYX92_02400 [Chloroflexi bacterium]|nr:hypothetical protein [Chloroflexota bacterium]
MATGRSMQLAKQVGEYLVSAELCRRGLISTTFTGNVPTFDILAINQQFETVPIQVKAKKTGSWQFDATNFLDISLSNESQTVNGKKELTDIICVLVALKGQNRDDFYVCRMRDLQDIIYRSYKGWLDKPGGKRPRNPKTTHCAVSEFNLKDHKDKWDIIAKS